MFCFLHISQGYKDEEIENQIKQESIHISWEVNQIHGSPPGYPSESLVEPSHHLTLIERGPHSIGPGNLSLYSLKNDFDACPRLRIIGLDFLKIPSNPRFLDSLCLKVGLSEISLWCQVWAEANSDWEPHLGQKPTWLLGTIMKNSGCGDF